MAQDILGLRKKNSLENIFQPLGLPSPDPNPFGPGKLFQTPPIQPTPSEAPPSESSPPPAPQATGEPSPNWIKILQDAYKPETGATNRFNELIGNMPERQDPGIARRIVASGMAIKGGMPAADAAMYAPHTRAMEDWKAQVDPAKDAANVERYANMNERQLLGNAATTMAWQERTDAAERSAARRAEVDRERIASNEKIQLEKNALIRWRDRGWKFNFDGPTVFMYNATGDFKDTGVKTANLSEMDRLELQQQLRLMENEQQGIIAQGLKQTPPGVTAAPTESNIRAARNQKFQKIVDENPWAINHLEQDNEGNWNFKPAPSAWFGSPNAEQVKGYNRVRELFGLPPDPTTQSKPPTPPAGRAQTPGVGPTPAVTEPWKPRSEYTPQTITKPKSDIASTVAPIAEALFKQPKQGDPGVYAPQKPPNAVAPPSTPPGRIAVYDAQGNLKGHIPDTPEQRKIAASQGLKPR